jgi:D-alanyl-D-alanine carboxypeptidase (penicillin-binding protein 5/6)
MTRVRTAPAALAAVLLVLSAPLGVAAVPRPVVGAKSAVLMDAASGVVLFQQGAHDRRPVASTTKIMTALVALESANLDARFTASSTVLGPDGSRLGIEPGEQWSLDDLLVALLLKSANDAAVVIAEGVGGSVTGFAGQMNRRAAALGAKDTHFVNPNGLYDPDHYSSAYDLALIAREALKQPRFRQLVATREADLFVPELGMQRLYNHNKLLWRDDRCDGIKTGYVRQSGQCLVASQTRGDWQLVSVVLDSPDIYADTLGLFDYGFRAYRQRLFARRGDAVGQARVRYGTTTRVPALAQRTLGAVIGESLPEAKLVVDLQPVTAPVSVGQRLGIAKLIVGGKVTASGELIAGAPVPRSWLKLVGHWALRISLGLLAVAVVVRTSAKVAKAYRRRGTESRIPPVPR